MRRPVCRPRLKPERWCIVKQQPTLDLQQVAAGRVPESADAVGGDDAMAGNDDRQAVVAARLPDRARIGAELARELAVGACLAARDLAHGIPYAALQRRALDHQRQIELRVWIRAIVLKLTCSTFGQRIPGLEAGSRRRQEPDLHHAVIARRHRNFHPRKGDDYVEHSSSICARRSSGTSIPALRAARSEAKRRAPGRRTSGSASMVCTTVSTRSENLSVPASAAGSMAMKACPMRGLLPRSEKNESASGPIAAPVSEAQMSSNMSASIAPFAPPIGKRLPCSIASFGSVVGFPCRSSAQPSGMRSPLRMAIMILPRTTVVSARSITIGSASFLGNAAATGLVPKSAFFPPQAGMAAGELVNAKPTSRASATGRR